MTSAIAVSDTIETIIEAYNMLVETCCNSIFESIIRAALIIIYTCVIINVLQYKQNSANYTNNWIYTLMWKTWKPNPNAVQCN